MKNLGADHTVWMHRLICSIVVHIVLKHVFHDEAHLLVILTKLMFCENQYMDTVVELSFRKDRVQTISMRALYA